MVAGWLSELNLAHIIRTFLEEGVDVEALSKLDDAQLKELGVLRMGDRAKVLPFWLDFECFCDRRVRDPARGPGWASPWELVTSVRGTGGEQLRAKALDSVAPAESTDVPEHVKILQRMGSPQVDSNSLVRALRLQRAGVMQLTRALGQRAGTPKARLTQANHG